MYTFFTGYVQFTVQKVDEDLADYIMTEQQQVESDLPPEKKRKIHVGLAECISYGQSEEGSTTLRWPIDRNAPGREPHQGLQPRYRTRRKFHPPRRVDGNSPSCSPLGASHAAEMQNNLDTTATSCQRTSCDKWDSDSDDIEMVEQSSDKSIEQLSVFGGFISAADVHRQPGPSWADTNYVSYADDGIRQTGYSGAHSFAKPRRKNKQWEKDSNQKSITQFFMQPSPGSRAENHSNDGLHQKQGNMPSCAGGRSSVASSSHQEDTIAIEKIVYGSPCKMYLPVKQVSDHLYVLGDEDSPKSLEKTMQNHLLPVPSSSSSYVKRLFDGQKAVQEGIQKGRQQRHSKTRNSKTATSKSSRSSKSGIPAGDLSAQKRKMDFLFGSAGPSPSNSAVRCDSDVGDSEEEFQSAHASYSTPAMKKEVSVGKTFGLLGDSKVKTIAINYFEQLPLDVIENIFCCLPLLDLCLNLTLVCSSWNDIISNEKFIPWKKLYYRVKLGEAKAIRTVEEITHAEGMAQSSLRLLSLLSYMQAFKRVSKDNNICELLQQHPKYTWAVALLNERAPHCFIEQDPNPWSLLCALVLLAARVEDITICLRLLTSARSHILSTEVLECLYCIATFLFAFKLRVHTQMSNMPLQEGLRRIPVAEAKQSGVVSGIHYRLIYAVYLFENASVSKHSVLQEAMAGWSGQQSIVKYSCGETEVRLTHEQMRIIKYTPDMAMGEVIKIFAFAGTGKTTTLVRYAQMRPNLKFLLLVFNKSVCEHAKIKFPSNVTCKTGHGLAYESTGRKYSAEKQLISGNLRVYDVLIGLPKRGEGEKENLFIRAKLVMTTLQKFMSSADEHVTTRHTPASVVNDDGMKEPIEHSRRMLYAQEAEHYWKRMKNLHDRDVKMTHDGYLKLYQLSKPKLWGYDIILVDEAQDLTPAVLDIVQSQTQPKIFVGDQHQQIYAFRGAVNAMAGVAAKRIFYLTQSFRFGPEISQVANIMLEMMMGERKKTLVGHGIPGKMSGERVGQLTILCRSNFTVFSEAVILCVYSDQPIKISFVGGLDAFGFDMLEDIYTLMMDPADRVKERREIKNKFIARFQNIAELEKYANRTSDVELLGKIRIVHTYHHNLPQCIAKIRQKSIRDQTQADVLLSTVHKAKGLEFSTVKVTDDFLDMQQILSTGILHPGMAPLVIPVEEVNLMYVAVTRAKHALIMSESLYTLLTQFGGGGVQPVLSENLKKQGISFICDESKTEFEPRALTLQTQEVTLSNKKVIRSSVYSPRTLVGIGSEYSHLMGDHTEQTNEDEEELLVFF